LNPVMLKVLLFSWLPMLTLDDPADLARYRLEAMRDDLSWSGVNRRRR